MYAYILVGGPGVGKTTFRKHLVKFNSHRMWSVLSYDDFLLDQAKKRKIEPEAARRTLMETAEKYVHSLSRAAFHSRLPVVWDTHDNMTVADRAAKLAQVPAEYTKIAVVFEEPESFRKPTLAHEIKPLEPMTAEEGFDEIRTWKA